MICAVCDADISAVGMLVTKHVTNTQPWDVTTNYVGVLNWDLEQCLDNTW